MPHRRRGGGSVGQLSGSCGTPNESSSGPSRAGPREAQPEHRRPRDRLATALRPRVSEGDRLQRAPHTPVPAVRLPDVPRELQGGDASQPEGRVGDGKRVGQIKRRKAVEDGASERREPKADVLLNQIVLVVMANDSRARAPAVPGWRGNVGAAEQRPGDRQPVGDDGRRAAQPPAGMKRGERAHEANRPLGRLQALPTVTPEEEAPHGLGDLVAPTPHRGAQGAIGRDAAGSAPLRLAQRPLNRTVDRRAHRSLLVVRAIVARIGGQSYRFNLYSYCIHAVSRKFAEKWHVRCDEVARIVAQARRTQPADRRAGHPTRPAPAKPPPAHGRMSKTGGSGDRRNGLWTASTL